MKFGARSLPGRCLSLTLVGMVVAGLAACTGRGGGYLAPDAAFTGRAQLGFTFSCEDSGGLNPPTGQLRIQLAYSDHGAGPTVGGPFAIHGAVDQISPLIESQICIGQNAPPTANELIFLGRYWPTSSSPSGFAASCPTRAASTGPLCRFEVVVKDNDESLTPSQGDFFSIKLSTATAFTSVLDPETVFYARAGHLAGGNLTVD